MREGRRCAVAKANTSFVTLHTYLLFTISLYNVDESDAVEVT
jgi:hypothetical protein